MSFRIFIASRLYQITELIVFLVLVAYKNHPLASLGVIFACPLAYPYGVMLSVAVAVSPHRAPLKLNVSVVFGVFGTGSDPVEKFPPLSA